MRSVILSASEASGQRVERPLCSDADLSFLPQMPHFVQHNDVLMSYERALGGRSPRGLDVRGVMKSWIQGSRI